LGIRGSRGVTNSERTHGESVIRRDCTGRVPTQPGAAAYPVLRLGDGKEVFGDRVSASHRQFCHHTGDLPRGCSNHRPEWAWHRGPRRSGLRPTLPIMLVGVAAIVSGWNLGLPMIGRTPTGHSSGVVNGLGVFSGSASSRCAPVLVEENHATLASGLIIEIRLNNYGRLSKYALGRNRARFTDTN
jgi:hypothetical protein